MESKKNEVLVNKIEIIEILPCFTTPGYIRFIAQADNRLDDVIPIIFLSNPIGKSNYAIKENTLTIRLSDKISDHNVTFFPSGKIGVTNTRDKDAAQEVIKIIKEMINNAYKEYLINGRPSEKELIDIKKISWMDLYKYLPKTNCGKCGFQACSAFAINVLQGDSKLAQCVLLNDPKYSKNLEKLKKRFGKILISSLGWSNS
ncbi:MAG: (Fe-S)-binding protein [Candidatus Helarchaeota archaeon]